MSIRRQLNDSKEQQKLVPTQKRILKLLMHIYTPRQKNFITRPMEFARKLP